MGYTVTLIIRKLRAKGKRGRAVLLGGKQTYGISCRAQLPKPVCELQRDKESDKFIVNKEGFLRTQEHMKVSGGEINLKGIDLILWA